MADQNLLNDDDFFSKSKSDEDKPKDKKEDVYSEEDNLFKNSNIDEQSAKELAYIESSLQERSDLDFDKPEQTGKDFSESLQSQLQQERAKQPAQEEHQIQPEQKPVEKPDEISYKQVYFDLDDEQQEKVSYKPFFISMLVVILLGAGGYFAYSYYLKDMFFSSATVEAGQNQQQIPSEPAVDDNANEQTGNQTQTASPVQSQKSAYLSTIANQTNQDAKSIANVIDASRKSVKLSSVLLYDSDFMFEVFGNSREELAQLVNTLKNSNNISNIKLISSSQRPGNNGGVFGVYSAKLKQAGAANSQVVTNLSNRNEAGNWLKEILINNKLTVKDYKDRPTESQDLFKIHEIEATANGSIGSCLNVLNAIASAGSNVKIYKLKCSAIDQQNFSASNYQLKLVLKVYV